MSEPFGTVLPPLPIPRRAGLTDAQYVDALVRSLSRWSTRVSVVLQGLATTVATEGNLAVFDANGRLQDSGVSLADLDEMYGGGGEEG